MDQCERIRSVFLHPMESYDLAEAARLTGTRADRLRREVERGDRDAVKVGDSWRFTWRQLVFVALERWTLAEIHGALGADAATALPSLLSLRAVTVRLPEYIIRALETVAADQRTTVDHYLTWELIDFAGCLPKRFVRQIPGYREAYLFPAHD